ncbi:MAG: hypothetical protein ACLTBV_23430 [Enterocloster bolteae]
MGYISRRMRRLRKMRCPRKMRRLKKMRRRAVKFWRERCPSVRRRKRFIRGVLFLLAALYRGLGKNRPEHEILGPGAGAVHGTD